MIVAAINSIIQPRILSINKIWQVVHGKLFCVMLVVISFSKNSCSGNTITVLCFSILQKMADSTISSTVVSRIYAPVSQP